MTDSALVSLQDVRAHLGFPTPGNPTSDDVALQGFINAADEVIRFECDETLPRRYSETHDGGDYKIFVYHRPVISVENLRENWGWISYDLDFQDAGTPASDTTMFGFSIDNPETGEISRRTVASVPIPFIPGEKNLSIQYVAGYSPVPANLTLATKELVAHWWQNSQLRAAAVAGTNIQYDAVTGAAYTRDTETGAQNLNVGVPARIIELIKPHRRLPVIG